jgi:predicted phosphodiesterase
MTPGAEMTHTLVGMSDHLQTPGQDRADAHTEAFTSSAIARSTPSGLMRYGVISDIHANLHALDAALEFLSSERLDAYLCAGDLVGYGPFPNECVHRVLELPGQCVAGNHDLIALGRLSDDRCIELARASLRWTRGVLSDETRDRLSHLSLGTVVQDVAVFHGSVTDPQQYVITEEQAIASLGELRGESEHVNVLILGHTHRPMAIGERSGRLLRGSSGTVPLPAGQRVVLNPGAVGQSRERDARAQVMVLDLAARTATYHRLRYDVAGCRAALSERGLPAGSHHLRWSRSRTLAAGARRRLSSRRGRA